MKVLFESWLDYLVIVLFGMVRRVFLSSVCSAAVPANFTFEWEISRLWRYVVGVGPSWRLSRGSRQGRTHYRLLTGSGSHGLSSEIAR